MELPLILWYKTFLRQVSLAAATYMLLVEVMNAVVPVPSV